MNTARLSTLIFFLFLAIHGYSQDQFQNTIKFDSTLGSPKATLQSLNWIVGSWRGEAFGGITEEVWTPASGGSMMCVFKLIVGGKVNFYEFVTIVEEKGTLLLRLKHFRANMKGWEEKDKTIDFPLVKVTENKVYFDEFTFEKAGADQLNIYVILSEKDGKKEEVKFHYQRVR